MKKLILLVLILTVGLQSIKGQEYPISITPQGYIFIQVNLNDSIPANFMLDTGAGINVLSQKLFDRISSTTKEVGVMTGFRHDGDRLDGPVYQIPSLAIGTTKELEVKAAIYPPLDQYSIDGLVSLKFFEDKPFTIDFKNQKLKILSKRELEQIALNNTKVPLQLKTERDIILDIFIPIVINGTIEMHAEFDTGSGYSPLVINPYYMGKLKLDKAELKTGEYTTPISGKKTTDYFQSVSVSLMGDQNISLSNKTATFREHLIFEALIGSEIFKDKAITIDIPDKRLIVH